MFNDVLAMEYLMKNKKYSNADHIWGSGMRITHMFFGLIISFLDTFYEIVISRHNNRKVHRVNRNKLKSLKVAQVKDEKDDDEDDGCGVLCDVVFDVAL